MPPMAGAAAALNAAKDHGGKHVHMTKTAGQPANGCICKVDQLVGDASLHNDVARDDKVWDGQQRKAVGAAEHLDDGKSQRVAA